MTSWWNDKLMKWQVDEMASWWNDLAPFFAEIKGKKRRKIGKKRRKIGIVIKAEILTRKAMASFQGSEPRQNQWPPKQTKVNEWSKR